MKRPYAYSPDDVKGYLTYNFIDKDPIIDLIRTLIVDVYGELNTASLTKIEQASGVKMMTLRNWFFGTTRRPFHASSVAVVRALGKDLKIVDRADGNTMTIISNAEPSPSIPPVPETSRIRIRINRPIKRRARAS